MPMVARYCETIGYEKPVERYLEENGYVCHSENYKGEPVTMPSGAALLLFGKGVDRMFREMQEAGSPEPVFEQLGFMVKASIYQHKSLELKHENTQEQGNNIEGQGNNTPKQGNNEEEQGIIREKICQLQGITAKTRENLLTIYEYMLSHPVVKNREISELVSVSDDRARVLLMTLVESEIVKCQGETKDREYFL